jgi:Tfp pilus assembly protein FimV
MSATICPTLRPRVVAVPVRRVRPVRRHAAVARPVPAFVYRRRRVAAVAALTAALGVFGGAAHDLLTGRGGDPASAATARSASPAVIVVAPGDTMWSIAEAHRGSIDRHDYIGALVEANGGSVTIVAGQSLRLP